MIQTICPTWDSPFRGNTKYEAGTRRKAAYPQGDIRQDETKSFQRWIM